jgi:ribonuclease HII
MLIGNIEGVDFLCGADESGAGCLAGPVVASAVIMPRDYYNKDLNDSKKMSKTKREYVYLDIIKNAIEYSITEVDNYKIDEINILQARLMAMDISIKKLSKTQHVLIDGDKFFKQYPISFETVIKGDGKWTCIAAASVLAKVYRDNLMLELHENFPNYNWVNNKGYGTKDHYDAINKYGITEHHRKTFLKSIHYF